MSLTLDQQLACLFPEPRQTPQRARVLVRLEMSTEAGGGERVGYILGGIWRISGGWVDLYGNPSGPEHKTYNRTHVVSVEAIPKGGQRDHSRGTANGEGTAHRARLDSGSACPG